MKKSILFFIVSLFITALTLQGQDTIPSCVWGVSGSGSGNQMLTEYTNSDSVFITAWDANGVIWAPRAFSGFYTTSNDTVTMYGDQAICGSDSGIYTFRLDTTCSRDRIIFTLVSDPCAGRLNWHTSFGNSQYPCYEWTNPIENTCWAIFNKFTNAYTVKEFATNNELYETEYGHNGQIITPRHQNGWYYNHYDTLTFVASPGSACGSDSGIYKAPMGCNTMQFFKISDLCTSRSASMIGAYEIFACWYVDDIGIEEILNNSNYSVYPNPASNSITIENLYKPIDANAEIVLYDLLGNKLLQEHIGEAGKTYQLHVGRLKAGVYILQVTQDHEAIITERIVIQN